MLRKVFGYFLNGVLFSVPLAVTGYIVYKLFTFFDSLIPVEKQFPGSGILILLVSLTTIGYFGGSLLAVPLRNWFHGMLDKIPFVKTMYNAITDLLSAFVGKKKRFNRPVLVRVNDTSPIERVGFITNDDLTHFGIGDDKVAVWVPHSYTYTGNLWIVPKDRVTPIDRNSGEIMKFIVSGGVVEIDEQE